MSYPMAGARVGGSGAMRAVRVTRVSHGVVQPRRAVRAGVRRGDTMSRRVTTRYAASHTLTLTSGRCARSQYLPLPDGYEITPPIHPFHILDVLGLRRCQDCVLNGRCIAIVHSESPSKHSPSIFIDARKP
jgi:hypothetical protein